MSKLKKEQEVNVFLHPEELEKLKLILLQMDEEITKSNEQIIQINDDISRLQSQKQINLERVKLSVNESAINENLLRLKEEKLSIEKNIAVLDSEIKSLKDEYNILIKEYNDKNNTQLKEKIKITTLKSDYNVKSKELFDLENKINIAKSNIENNSFLPKSKLHAVGIITDPVTSIPLAARVSFISAISGSPPVLHAVAQSPQPTKTTFLAPFK